MNTQEYLEKSGISINVLHLMFQEEEKSLNIAQVHNSTLLSWQEFSPCLVHALSTYSFEQFCEQF